MDSSSEHWPSDSASSASTKPQEIAKDPMEFLSRSWSAAALEVVKALSPPTATGRGGGGSAILEDLAGEVEEEDVAIAAGNPFTFACSATSQLVMERIMSQSEVLQLTTGRLSHSSGPLNGGSMSDSPPVSPSDTEDVKYCRATVPAKPAYKGGSRTMGRWLKDRRERKKEETRAHNAQLHAAVSVAGVAAAVAAVAAATAAASVKDDCAARTNLAIASAATLVAAQCVEAAEVLGAEREHLAATVASAVSVRSPGDIATLTAAAATGTLSPPLRGAATLKARVLKEMWNIAAVIPVEKGFAANQNHHSRHSDGEAGGSSGELFPGENFLGLCSQELLARGSELLKRTRKGDLHWKIVSVYIHRTGLVKLKMKSRHVAGTITKKKKNVVIGVNKDISAWPGRHLLEGGEERRYFGLKTAEQRVIEFECRGQREYEMWTQGVARLLAIVGEKARPAVS
ncbi:hypothetical protein IEQ34_020895 [Dendrobium chrysotoxum]|uniref:VAN3-binding protein n=1 Tax=Dendrobium chrysotoxum TaxID=161865 RepID=A0AAV7G394_DENCH|nr:hypothetical protein IEQ34_020895 [Dendrobium chrysotoxum]